MRSNLIGVATVAALAIAGVARPQIYRWDNREVIPGTEGIFPGPGVQLDHRELEYAKLEDFDLTGANFHSTNASRAHFWISTLTGANFSETNLTDASFDSAILTNAEFENATINGALFAFTTFNGFTKEQLYATASYKTRDLQRTRLGENNLNAWDFSGQNLSGAELAFGSAEEATFADSNLTGADLFMLGLTRADFSRADLTQASFVESNLTDAILSEANIAEADFHAAAGLTEKQVYSTASYQEQDLHGTKWDSLDLQGWDFSQQNLTNAAFGGAQINGVDLSDSVVAGAAFSTHSGFSPSQLYSTLSYKTGELSGIRLSGDFSGWDFHSQDMVGAFLNSSTLIGADLRGTNLSSATLVAADLTDAQIAGANFADTTSRGFRASQLYATEGYRAGDLRGVGLGDNNLSGWDLTGQNIEGIDLSGSSVTFFQFSATASFAARNLRGVQLNRKSVHRWDLTGQELSSAGFRKSILDETNFSQGKLNSADFSESSSVAAEFYAADLDHADFSNARAVNANFANANLSGATFGGATLTGSDLRGAVNWNLSGAQFQNVVLPDGAIHSLNIGTGEELLIRDDDGVAAPPARPWLATRDPIPVSISDAFAVAEGGVLSMKFDADPWDSTISFEPGIPVALGGMLNLDFSDHVDLTAQLGRTFRLFDWSGVAPAGQFQMAGPFSWDTSSLYETGEVSLTAIPEPATFAMSVLAAASVIASARRSRIEVVMSRP